MSPKNIANELARIAKHPYVAGQRGNLLTPEDGRVENDRGEDDRAEATAHEDDETPLPSGGRGTPRKNAQRARAPKPGLHATQQE